MRNVKNQHIISSVALLGSLALVQAQQGPGPVIGCVLNNEGLQPPGSEACVDLQIKRCRCIGWACQWTCPPSGCARCLAPAAAGLVKGCPSPKGLQPPGSEACIDHQIQTCSCKGLACGWICPPPPHFCLKCNVGGEASSGGCSDPTDLDEDLRAELDSPATSCDFPCNCIASGNQIAHKLNVKTYEECDNFCQSFPDYCNYWTFINSKSVCFALTNCNYPRCGEPFHTYVSGPKSCLRPTAANSGPRFNLQISNQLNRNMVCIIVYEKQTDYCKSIQIQRTINARQQEFSTAAVSDCETMRVKTFPSGPGIGPDDPPNCQQDFQFPYPGLISIVPNGASCNIQ